MQNFRPPSAELPGPEAKPLVSFPILKGLGGWPAYLAKHLGMLLNFPHAGLSM